jgi:nanoRNase/pAp phosphatase (c-di-AMP/oligoRNAs hydrolase)
MDPQAAKQQIVERIKQAENILVTVSADPSVDQLASCIGFRAAINKWAKALRLYFPARLLRH